MAIYHRLDPFWSRFPWPDRTVVDEASVGPVKRFRLCRSFFGRRMMATHCYALGDTLIDTGFPSAADAVLQIAERSGLRRVVLTHHHEDHAGGIAALVKAGFEVSAGELTCRLLAHDLPLPFYQHMAWGRTRPVHLEPDRSPTVRIGDYEADVIDAPGHAVDQRVFHVAEEGWLFSGDVFIHERVKVFRRDEDFAASIESLRRLVALDFDALFCGHRPVSTGGPAALQRKLEWLLEVEDGVRRLDAEGQPLDQIVKRLRLERSAGFRRISMGDASAHNMVRSILNGPTQRAEVKAALCVP
ncbi:MAG: MBL fold metallo-hydrolase [Acidobacteriota bacterium]